MSSSELRKRVLDAARAEPSAPRSERRWQNLVRVVLGFTATFCSFLLVGGLRLGGTTAARHLSRPTVLVLETALGASAMTAVALFTVFGRRRSMLGRPRSWLWLVIVLTPLGLLAWKVLASSTVPEMMLVWPERLGLKCLSLSVLFCLPPLLLIALLRRGSDPVHPISMGAAAGVAVGGVGWVLVDLWCPVAYLPHLLLGHFLPLVLLGAAGGLVGRWLLAPRAR